MTTATSAAAFMRCLSDAPGDTSRPALPQAPQPISPAVSAIVEAFSTKQLLQVNGTDVAANTEISETVPAGKHWELIAVSVALVQGATQTPQPILVLDDGTDVVFESFGSSAAQAASTTCRYTWAPGNPLTGLIGTGTNVHSVAPLPAGLRLPPGYRIRTVTLGIGANSNYGVPSLLVVEWA